MILRGKLLDAVTLVSVEKAVIWIGTGEIQLSGPKGDFISGFRQGNKRWWLWLGFDLPSPSAYFGSSSGYFYSGVVISGGSSIWRNWWYGESMKLRG